MPSIQECALPNGQKVFYRSKADVDILSRELLREDNLYLRNGITVQDGDCIVDVGANIGFFLLFLSRQIERGRILAFEPIPETHEVLKRNAERHCRLDNRLFNCGLADRNTTTDFTYFPRTSVASTMYPDGSPEFRRNSRRFVLQEIAERAKVLEFAIRHTPEWLWYPLTEPIRRHFQSARTVTCQLRRLSDVLREERVERIDLLKVDTEGAEEDVLRGIDDEHWGCIRQIVVEVHRGVESLRSMENLLREQQFQVISEPAMPGVDHLHVVFGRR